MSAESSAEGEPSQNRPPSQQGSGSSSGPASASQSSSGSGTLSSVDTLPVTLPSVPEEAELQPWGRLLPMAPGFRSHGNPLSSSPPGRNRAGARIHPPLCASRLRGGPVPVWTGCRLRLRPGRPGGQEVQEVQDLQQEALQNLQGGNRAAGSGGSAGNMSFLRLV